MRWSNRTALAFTRATTDCYHSAMPPLRPRHARLRWSLVGTTILAFAASLPACSSSSADASLADVAADASADASADAASDTLADGTADGTADTLADAATDAPADAPADVADALPPPGTFAWAKSLGGTGEDIDARVDVDASGNVYVIGSFGASADFGSGPLTGDVVIALAPDGSLRWARALGDQNTTLAGVTHDGAGNVFVALTFSGTYTLDGLTFVSAGGRDAAVLKLDSTGKLVAAKRLGGTADDDAIAIAPTPGGGVVVVGALRGSADFGGGTLVSQGGADLFVAKLDGALGLIFGERFGGPGEEGPSSVAVGASGQIAIGGVFTSSTLSLPTGPLSNAGSSDGLVLRLDANGVMQAAFSIGSAKADFVYGVALDDAGGLGAAGSIQGPVTVLGAPLTPMGSAPALVLATDASGALRFAKLFDGGVGTTATARAIAATKAGFLVVGSFATSIDLGDGPRASAGNFEGFALSLGTGGAHAWSTTFGTLGRSEATGVVIGADGSAYLAGDFGSTASLGGIPLTSHGADDVYVAKLRP